jgi:hypothetical protein
VCEGDEDLRERRRELEGSKKLTGPCRVIARTVLSEAFGDIG